jgi:hypothetical protein
MEKAFKNQSKKYGSLCEQTTMHSHLASHKISTHQMRIERQIENEIEKKMVMQFF